MNGFVLITGASGGYGQRFAEAFAQRKHPLILHGRNEAALKALAARLDVPVRIACADLAQPQGVHALLAFVEDLPLAGVVNNAGFGLWGAFTKLDWRNQQELLHTDLVAPMAIAHALVPGLIEQKGFLINVASLAGSYPLPFMASYSAAKGGLWLWSESLRAELRGRLRVVTLCPGPSPTGFRRISGMPKGPGNFFSTPAEIVVQKALRTLDRGGGICIPGIRHRWLWLLQRLIPVRWGAPLLARKLSPEALGAQSHSE